MGKLLLRDSSWKGEFDIEIICTTIFKIAESQHKAQLLVLFCPLNDLEDLQFVH
jgi:hypothetical protein